MRTIILNGSPKADSKTSNTEIFIKHFIKDMKKPCEVRYIAKEDPKELAQYTQSFDTILMVLPLYIHAMPGIVMKFIECLEPEASGEKHIGFIIQAGFPETAQEKFVERYFAELAKQLHYNYLGTVSKGGAAAIYMFPKKFKKLYKQLSDLGRIYEETHVFDKEITKKLAYPYNLPKFQLGILKVLGKIGLDNVGWNMMLKQNQAFDKRLDKPFL